ncbi:MAG TPA: hypothetical protein VGG44_11020 [Tepidisphaeraceae bacterium]
MTYSQAAELTWPQLMHVLGIDCDVPKNAVMEGIEERQEMIFDRIRIRRGYLPVDLLRLPVADLGMQVAVEADGQLPTIESVSGALQRYVGERRKF